MSDIIADIIERIKEGIEEKGEFELQLIDQMALAKEGIDLFEICQEENWTPESESIGTSITISGGT